ncbi:hypothetical protein AN396_05500 [Candidatus Epulonipiscium fishelsonii]|uniref:Uncharacterized protein n=1 Tax=Candidatus Epulonipiscium fishelsonii TaxID=77094 RepID=A0ACC8XD35_9FIRM|nr:hypothetical protein AN396_05500 [Epulopiscium sp. SCG-B11WGA-EpuloA1]
MENKIFETKTGIKVIDTPFLTAQLSLYLILEGDKAVLIDTGVADTPKTYIDKFLSDNGLSYSNIENVIITHAHHDHFGGNYYVSQKNPLIKFISHKLDYEWIEDHQKHYHEMYLTHAPIWMPDEAYKDGLLQMCGKNSVVHQTMDDPKTTLNLLGNWQLEAIHIGSHTKGEIILHSKKHDTVFTSDTIQGCGSQLETGCAVFPLINDLEKYIDALHLLRDLNCHYVCTSHQGVLDKAEFTIEIETSFKFIEDLLNNIKGLFNNPISLNELVDSLWKEFYSNYEKGFQIYATTYAFCNYLKDKEIISKISDDGVLKWVMTKA